MNEFMTQQHTNEISNIYPKGDNVPERLDFHDEDQKQNEVIKNKDKLWVTYKLVVKIKISCLLRLILLKALLLTPWILPTGGNVELKTTKNPTTSSLKENIKRS